MRNAPFGVRNLPGEIDYGPVHAAQPGGGSRSACRHDDRGTVLEHVVVQGRDNLDFFFCGGKYGARARGKRRQLEPGFRVVDLANLFAKKGIRADQQDTSQSESPALEAAF